VRSNHRAIQETHVNGETLVTPATRVLVIHFRHPVTRGTIGMLAASHIILRVIRETSHAIHLVIHLGFQGTFLAIPRATIGTIRATGLVTRATHRGTVLARQLATPATCAIDRATSFPSG
jgi:hypothetical protein